MEKKDEEIFLGREIATHRDYSEQTAQKIDAEVSKVVRDNYTRAKKLLSDHIDILEKLAQELLVKEVLNTEELDALVGMSTEGDSDRQQAPERETAV